MSIFPRRLKPTAPLGGPLAGPALYQVMSTSRANPGRQHPLAADATPCTCPYIKLGSEQTDARNWNPDCPEHGTDSEWYRSEAQVLHRQIDSIKLRMIQAIAQLRRNDRLSVDEAWNLVAALDGTGRWSGNTQEV